MPRRSLGVTALAFVSVMVALYCQMAAIALLLTGSIFSGATTQGFGALVVGALYLGVAVASYLLGYGFWARTRWSWAAGLAVFSVFVLASLALAVVSGSFGPALVPAGGVVAAMWYLTRPGPRAELLGSGADSTAPVQASEAPKLRADAADPLELAEPVR